MSRKCNCENIRDRVLFAISEGEDDVLASLESEGLCEECKKFIYNLAGLYEALKELSNVYYASFPQIEVSDKVLEKLKSIQKEELNVREILDKQMDNPEEAEWIAFIENELDDVSRYRCLHKLNSSKYLEKEIESLRQIHSELENFGNQIDCIQLDEDLLPKIMAKLPSYVGTPLDNEFAEGDGLETLEKELLEISENKLPSSLLENNNSKKQDSTVNILNNWNYAKRTSKRDTKKSDRVYRFPVKRFAQILTFAASLLLVLLGSYWFLMKDTNNLSPRFKLTSNVPTSVVKEKEKFRIVPPPTYSNESGDILSNDNRKDDIEKPNRYTTKPLSEWEQILKENALVNAGKLMRMGTWASLTPEEARELLKKSGLSPMAILGAIQFLPPAEAKTILEAAIANNPEDAYLRFAMVNTLKNMDNVDYEELSVHLSAWTKSDPSNVLPYYMEANIYLRDGEIENALTCIKEARNVQGYNSYALITAQAYKEALIAKGVAPQLAELLASASLGARELQTLDELAQTLLDYGKYYESIGDYNTAFMIYDALKNLGVNVDLGSNLLQERLAGVKYAQEALYALIRIMTQTYSFSDIQSYIAFLQDLNQLLTNYNNALASFYELFDKLDPQTIIQLLNSYLNTGNVTINPPSQSGMAK